MIRALIACEESQRVCKEFRKLGVEAFSCDIIEESGGCPQWHIQSDVLPLLNGNVSFYTRDGKEYYQNGEWDIIVAFPPCTYLTVTGNRWFNINKYGDDARMRRICQLEAIEFFLEFVNCKCEHIAIENPVGVMSTYYKKPQQYIQPYFFGNSYTKKTCLWLKNLPKLTPTAIVDSGPRVYYASGKSMPAWYNSKNSRERSKTFIGIAKAMAEQWTQYLIAEGYTTE